MTEDHPRKVADLPSTGDRTTTPYERLRRILEEEETQETPKRPIEYQYLDERLKLQEIELRKDYAKQEIQLRRNYATGLLIILTLQLAFSSVVFWVFAEVGEHWKLSDSVIQIWLAAVVVQVVGVVTVVTRHLFPRRDGKPDVHAS